MAHGKTLELIRFSQAMRDRLAATRYVDRPGAYHLPGGKVLTHARVRPELGDRRKYRAIRRRERAEAQVLRDRAREQWLADWKADQERQRRYDVVAHLHQDGRMN